MMIGYWAEKRRKYAEKNSFPSNDSTPHVISVDIINICP